MSEMRRCLMPVSQSVAPHTCRPSVQNMLHVTLTAATILRCVPEFSQICVGPSRELGRGVKVDWTDSALDQLLPILHAVI
jgi:hypothetical protein